MKPRIVSSSHAAIAEGKPPTCSMAHPWSIPGCRPSKGNPDALYLANEAEERIRKHAVAHRGEKLEVMGYLLGEVKVHQGARYAVCRQAVTTTLDATQVGVRFAREGLNLLAQELANVKFDYVIVGWYHSHPGYGCFLSSTDVQTQRAMFSEPHHVALVVDPVKEEAGAFRLTEKGYEPVRFSVMLA